jgi:hypothetical protein
MNFDRWRGWWTFPFQRLCAPCLPVKIHKWKTKPAAVLRQVLWGTLFKFSGTENLELKI